MASGDPVQVIFPNTAIPHYFQPAANVTVMITNFANRSGIWGGYVSATYPVSASLNDTTNGANTNTSSPKIPITNTIYWYALGTVSRYINLGGIEL